MELNVATMTELAASPSLSQTASMVALKAGTRPRVDQLVFGVWLHKRIADGNKLFTVLWISVLEWGTRNLVSWPRVPSLSLVSPQTDYLSTNLYRVVNLSEVPPSFMGSSSSLLTRAEALELRLNGSRCKYHL